MVAIEIQLEASKVINGRIKRETALQRLMHLGFTLKQIAESGKQYAEALLRTRVHSTQIPRTSGTFKGEVYSR